MLFHIWYVHDTQRERQASSYELAHGLNSRLRWVVPIDFLRGLYHRRDSLGSCLMHREVRNVCPVG